MSIIKNHVEISAWGYISDYYDTNGEIKADSDPAQEYAIWCSYCAAGNDDVNLLTEKDFEDFIESKK